MQAMHIIGGRLAAALGVAALALLALLLGACGSAASVEPDPAATGAESKTAAPVAGIASIKMDIAGRASNLTREDLMVQQGDTVNISFTADEAGEIHLHGYNLTAPVAPGAPGQLDFEAATAGAFGINFHIYAESDEAKAGNGAGGGMSHGDDAIALSVPAVVAVAATPDGSGGLNVAIDAEGWRWAPEQVNGEHRPGEGHGHIYVDGVKVNRIYGPNYHLAGLEPGERHIRVTLNANSHNGLTVDGQPLEAAMVVTVPETDGGQRAAPAAVAAPAAMAVSAAAHPDPLGGYNLEAQVEGFVFAPPGQGDADGGPASGAAGYGLVAIDGALHGRLYGAWQKLPALEPGTHTIAVTLHDGDGAPYWWDGRPVAASVTVDVPEKDGGNGGSGGGHHGDSDSSSGGHHEGSDSNGGGHHGGGGSGGNGGHSYGDGSDAAVMAEDGDDGGRAVVAEVHLGNLEVYP